jgi:4-hydroxybenzoate polyprenyltransferase
VSAVAFPSTLVTRSGAFARAYWTTVRPYLFLVSGSTGLVGLAMNRDLAPARLVAGCVVFCVAYGLGQALTDLSQTDTDAISAPYRPLVRGEVRRAHVLAVTLLGLGACTVALVVMSRWLAPLALLSVLGLAAYTPMKRRFWAGPAWNSWIVALLPAMGALCDGRPPSALVGSPRVWAAMASAFFSYATFVLLGYLKDVEADRATGYVTLPVRFGRGATVGVSAACVPPALVASLVATWGAWRAGGFAPVIGLLAWIVAAIGLVLAHIDALAASRDDLAYRAVATGVRGYVALHLAEAMLMRPALCLPSLSLYGLFELALAHRPCREQV